VNTLTFNTSALTSSLAGLVIGLILLRWAVRATGRLIVVAGRPGLRRLVHWWQGWAGRPLVEIFIGLIYGIGAPYLALLLGWVTPRQLGLSHLDWPRSLGIGLTVAGATLVLLWAASLSRPTHSSAGAHANTGGSLSPLLLVIQVISQEGHWALYRAWAIAVLGLYLGSWSGLGLIALELILAERITAWQSHYDRVVTLLLATTSCFLFLLIANTWMAGLAHLLVRGALKTKPFTD